jgi:hypothetical protein
LRFVDHIRLLRGDRHPFWNSAGFLFLGGSPTQSLLSRLVKSGAERFVRFSRNVGYSLSLRCQAAADGLLMDCLQGPRTAARGACWGFPAKTFEYLAFGKPLLCVVEAHHEMWRYLKRMRHVFLVDPQDGRDAQVESLNAYGQCVLRCQGEPCRPLSIPSRDNLARIVHSYLSTGSWGEDGSEKLPLRAEGKSVVPLL